MPAHALCVENTDLPKGRTHPAQPRSTGWGQLQAPPLPLANPRLWPYLPDHIASAIFDLSDSNSNPFSLPFAEVYSEPG